MDKITKYVIIFFVSIFVVFGLFFAYGFLTPLIVDTGTKNKIDFSKQENWIFYNEITDVIIKESQSGDIANCTIEFYNCSEYDFVDLPVEVGFVDENGKTKVVTTKFSVDKDETASVNLQFYTTSNNYTFVEMKVAYVEDEFIKVNKYKDIVYEYEWFAKSKRVVEIFACIYAVTSFLAIFVFVITNAEREKHFQIDEKIDNEQ